ncbi:hypothetical protein FSP39_016453 [Pinctada imbricata]|uniref:L-Fucosyltransferase n=1 Tax=Pinctada imbricata TaxID=66713 RepID=A0AA88Y978_PINIB|nr:hypothetical protein FSP39_016453 [Pinctada imbricata]
MRRGRKKRLAAICIFVVSIYILLVWMFEFPSVAHIPSIRVWWDEEYSACKRHVAHQQSLPENQRAPLYLSVSFSGRLGNWMYAYASLYGLAKRTGRKIYLQPENQVSGYFNIPKNMNVEPICPEVLIEPRPAAYTPEFESLPHGVNVTIKGYMQSWKYFRKEYDADIKKQYKLRDDIMEKGREALKKFKSKISRKFDLLISVHIRRQDKLDWGAYLKGFRAAPVSYAKNAQNYMRQYFKDKAVQFLVMSDDYEWSSKHLKAEDTAVMEPNDKYVDLAVLTMCNHSIITVGTFGWWGAYLAGGHTVFFQDYAAKGSRFDQETEREDFYLPQWIGMS